MGYLGTFLIGMSPAHKREVAYKQAIFGSEMRLIGVIEHESLGSYGPETSLQRDGGVRAWPLTLPALTNRATSG